MKKNIVITIATVVFLLFSCEKVFDDALDRIDDSRETFEGMLADVNKVKGMFVACYAGVPWDRSDIYFWTTLESLTDNAFDPSGQSMENWRMGLTSPSFTAVWPARNVNNWYARNAGWWGRYWGAIRHCNTFINNVDKITVPLDQLPMSERELMRDEAIILRAYFHWLLISIYGPLPFLERTPDVDWDGWQTISRPTYQEITDKIVAELNGVISRGIVPMKRDPFSVNDKYRVPLGFAYGLVSRVLLYNASPLNNPTGDAAKYEAAAAAAKRFIDLNVHSLEPWENTKAMYISPLTENLEAREVIWRGRDRLAQLGNVHGMDFSATVPRRSNFAPHKAGETPTQEIVDCYELKNGAMIIASYDASHANPAFTPEALASGYDDINNPYANRDDRFYRDILFNGNYFGESFQMGTIDAVWTYFDAPGTGTNGIATTGDGRRTYTGYYYAKDRNPLFFGAGTLAAAIARSHHHSIWMRYAEIWLNYAEALCGAGRLNEAADALDMTRKRANQPPIRQVPGFQLNKEWLMHRIYNERRVEMVLEDHRFYDVRRWDLISHQNHNTISGILVEQKAGGGFTHTRYQMPHTWECHNERHKILPIPLVDQVLMPNLLQPEAWR